MSLNQLLEASAQGALIEVAAQAQRGRNVVGGALRVQLPDNPQTILRQRLRQITITWQQRDAVLAGSTRRLLACDFSTELSQRGRFEQQPQIQLKAQRLTQATHHLRRGNGITAEQEEIVVVGDVLDL